jgi:hypothetical protein
MSTFKFTFDGTAERNLSEYQKLVLYYFLGKMTLESSEFVPENTEVVLKKSSVPNDTAIVVMFYGISPNLLREYLPMFPFKLDTQVLDKNKEYAGLYIHRRDISVKPVTIQEISFNSLK